jgi:hypothetical protein
MADKNEAKGCGCLILLGIVGFAIYKIGNWVSNNKETVDRGIEIAKQVGIWAAVIIISWVILSKILKYRGRIKRWENGEFQEYLNQNSTEECLSRGESGGISHGLSEIESALPQAERRLNEVKRMEEEANRRK